MNGEIHTLEESQKLHPPARPIDYLIDPKTECWHIVSHVLNCDDRYRTIMRNRRSIHVHRYSYELVYGQIPDGLYCCHRCDNSLCINPDHLFLGTPKDNIQDAVRKGRMAHGENHGNHKLMEVDIQAIRADETSTQRDLGRKYGVCHSNIGLIKRGESWTHIPMG